tara:strand:- start:174 stop:308 length:135 start_codon:yes stop_codon:yes gene_type:complete
MIVVMIVFSFIVVSSYAPIILVLSALVKGNLEEKPEKSKVFLLP